MEDEEEPKPAPIDSWVSRSLKMKTINTPEKRVRMFKDIEVPQMHDKSMLSSNNNLLSPDMLSKGHSFMRQLNTSLNSGASLGLKKSISLKKKPANPIKQFELQHQIHLLDKGENMKETPLPTFQTKDAVLEDYMNDIDAQRRKLDGEEKRIQ